MCNNVYLVMCILIVATCAWGMNIDSDGTLLNCSTHFPCGLPQPRACPVSELTEEVYTYYSPPFVVLHRCENSGCCEKQNHSCQPHEAEDVLLPIKVDINNMLCNVKILVKNHTRCFCSETQTLIK